MEFGLSFFLAVAGLLVGFFAWKLHKVVGIVTGIVVLMFFLGVTLTALTGSAGFIATLNETPLVSGIFIYTSAHIIGSTVSAFTG